MGVVAAGTTPRVARCLRGCARQGQVSASEKAGQRRRRMGPVLLLCAFLRTSHAAALRLVRVQPSSTRRGLPAPLSQA